MRTVAPTSELHDLEVVAYVDRLGYARCRDCADALDAPGEPTTPTAFSIEDRCETCACVLLAVGCAHWRSPVVDVSPHPEHAGTDLVRRRCEKCGTERVLHSGRYAGSGRTAGSGSDPDRGADRHLSGGRR